MNNTVKNILWTNLMELVEQLNDVSDSLSDMDREAVRQIADITDTLNRASSAYIYTLTLITHEYSGVNEFVIARYGIGSKTVEYNYL